MSILIYDSTSSSKEVHFPDCSSIKAINPLHLKTFSSLNEARRDGYHLCNCCSPAASHYYAELESIALFCRRSGFTTYLVSGEINIMSDIDVWKIVPFGRDSKLTLFHQNSLPAKATAQSDSIRGFHLQYRQAESILEYLEYIRSHDAYRKAHPVRPSSRDIQYASEHVKASSTFGFPMTNAIHSRNKSKRLKEEKRLSQIIRTYTQIDLLQAC